MFEKMKSFKKIIVFFMILICLSGCVTFYERFESYDEVSNIEKIEIFYVDSKIDSYIVDIPSSKQPIAVLEEDVYNEIVVDLENFIFKNIVIVIAANDPNFYLFEFVIKISYNSGVYQLVSNSRIVYTYNNGEILNSFYGVVGQETWDSLIIKYIGKELVDKYNS